MGKIKNLLVGFFCIFILPFYGQIVNIESKRFLNDTNGFIGTAGANFSINQNTQQVLTIGANLHMQYQKNRSRLLALGDLVVLKAGNKDFANAGFQHLRYSYKISSFLTWETFVQAQFNKVLLLDRRYLAGSGPRIKVIKTKRIRVYAACLYMYEFESRVNETLINYNHRLSSYITITIDLGKIDFNSTTFFQPNINNFNDYRIASDSNFELEITKNLNFKVGFNLLFDTRQPVGVPELTYILKNGLTYKF
jgi:hypothetical protein